MIAIALSLVQCSSDSRDPAGLIEPSEVTQIIDQEGGSIEWRYAIVEIPPGALEGPANVTLSDSDFSPADSVGLDISLEQQPIALTISGASVADSIFITLPPLPNVGLQSCLAFASDEQLYPLQAIETGVEWVRVALPPELTDMRGPCSGAILQMNLDFVKWPDDVPRLQGPSVNSVSCQQRPDTMKL